MKGGGGERMHVLILAVEIISIFSTKAFSEAMHVNHYLLLEGLKWEVLFWLPGESGVSTIAFLYSSYFYIK